MSAYQSPVRPVMSNPFKALETTDDHPLLQGDLFKWDDHRFRRPFRTYGVVVTADCDLIKNKVRGSISYVPALLMEDFIWHHWKTDRFKGTLDGLIGQFTSRLNNRLQKLNSSQRDVSKEAAVQWLQRVGIDQLLQELDVQDSGQRKQFEAIADDLNALISMSTTSKPDLMLLQKCFRLKNRKRDIAENDLSPLADEIQSSISSLPGDIFYLPIEESDTGIDDGLFLMLRHIDQLDSSKIAICVSDFTLGSPHAKRLGRISAPYRYAMTQNLARVFSDIGLPSSYETRRDSSSRKFFKVPK